MDHAILHGKPFGIFLYFKYNKALSDDNGMVRTPSALGCKGVPIPSTLQDTLARVSGAIYNYWANFCPISVKCLPNHILIVAERRNIREKSVNLKDFNSKLLKFSWGICNLNESILYLERQYATALRPEKYSSIPGRSKIDLRGAFLFIFFSRIKGMLFAEMASTFLISKCKH
jgi:hypothetical protein